MVTGSWDPAREMLLIVLTRARMIDDIIMLTWLRFLAMRAMLFAQSCSLTARSSQARANSSSSVTAAAAAVAVAVASRAPLGETLVDVVSSTNLEEDKDLARGGNFLDMLLSSSTMFELIWSSRSESGTLSKMPSVASRITSPSSTRKS